LKLQTSTIPVNILTSASQPQESKAIKIEAPPQSTSTPQPPSQQAKPTPGTAPQVSQISGLGYPALHTSSVDVNANPTYPGLNKPLLQVDLDADLAEEHKLWRRPGEDYSDYFNYGFDEFTWETYRLKQQQMSQTIQQQKAEMAQMQQMMSGGMPGMPPMPGAGAPAGAPQGPGGMNGMGGMPPGGMDENQMQMMMQQMASSGMDPSQMDFATFMQMAGGGMGGPGGPGGFGGGQQGGGFQQGHQGGGGRGGRGRGRGW
jgi:pre-mRNA 3'-end-processing factor FIP1